MTVLQIYHYRAPHQGTDLAEVFIYSFIYSSFHSSLYSFIHLFNYPFIRPSFHSFVYSFIHSSFHSPIHPFILPFTRSYFHSSLDWIDRVLYFHENYSVFWQKMSTEVQRGSNLFLGEDNQLFGVKSI